MMLNNKVGLGTVQFGLNYGISNFQGKTNSEEVVKILELAYQNGVQILDTAQSYGDSEVVIGKIHNNRFKIVTKFQPNNGDPRSAHNFVKKSLDKLQIDHLYGLLFHTAESALNNPRILIELKKLQEQGKISKLGYSVYDINELISLINKYGNPDILQVPYNHLDRRFEYIIETLHAEGVEIHSRSTFLQGIYFCDSTLLPGFFDPIKPYLNKLKSNFVDNQNIANALLDFSLSKRFIDHVIIGVNSEHQLQENLKIESIRNSLPEIPENIPEQILNPSKWPK